MAFQVNFYQVSKRLNSTFVPADSDIQRTVGCVVKDGTGVLNPTITIAMPSAEFNPSVHNYCYIPDFHRYYWVSDWVNQDNMWSAHLDVDVLATYKDDIISKNFYILRTSTAFDTNIIDTMYTAKSNHNMKLIGATLWDEVSYNNGSIVAGIMGKDGLIFYYVFTPTLFRKFIELMFGGTDWMNISDSDIPTAVQKAVVNPAQYIISAKWFPFDCSTDVLQTSVNVGWWNIPLSGSISIFTQGALPKTFHTTITRTAHPQSSRGDWLNHEPYTNLDVFVRPFGSFHLDSNLTTATHTIDIYCNVDLITGESELIVRTNSQILALSRANIACPIQVGDIAQSQTKASIVETGVAKLASNIFGSTGADTTAVDNFIGNALGASTSKATIRFSSGSMLSTYGNILLSEDFTLIADEDNPDNGRPYCSNNNMETLGNGFYMVENGNMSIPRAYSSEIESVRIFLERGVYYA